MVLEKADLPGVLQALETVDKDALVGWLQQHIRDRTREAAAAPTTTGEPAMQDPPVEIVAPEAPQESFAGIQRVKEMAKRYAHNPDDAEAFTELSVCLLHPAFLQDPEAADIIEQLAQLPISPWEDHAPNYFFEGPDEEPLNGPFGNLPLPTRMAHYDRQEDVRLPAEPMEFPFERPRYPRLRPGITNSHLPTFRKLAESEVLKQDRHMKFRNSMVRAGSYLFYQQSLQRVEQLAAESLQPIFPVQNWTFAQADAQPEGSYAEWGFGGPKSEGYYRLVTDEGDVVSVTSCQKAEKYPYGVARFYITSEEGLIGTGVIAMVRNDVTRYGEASLGINPPIPEKWRMHVIPATPETTGYFSVHELAVLMRAHPEMWESNTIQKEIEELAALILEKRNADIQALPVKVATQAARTSGASASGGAQTEEATSEEEPPAPVRGTDGLNPSEDVAVADALTKAGISITTHRKRILAVLQTLGEPTNPAVIMQLIRQRFGNCMVPATLSNNLVTFEGAGLITIEHGIVQPMRTGEDSQ